MAYTASVQPPKFLKMNFKFKFSWAIFAIAFLALSSCGNDDDCVDCGGGEEVITTLNLTLTPTTGDVVTMSFQDLDGDGGNDPTITNGTLQANMTYTGSIEVLNESESPAEDITAEIMTEDDEHQFFFVIGSSLNLTVAYGDQDGNGNPLGLATTVTTTDASSGSLTVTLRHQPDKTASGVSDGDITNAGGETDIEVTFDVTVQ